MASTGTAVPPAALTSGSSRGEAASAPEFAEITSVTLEWKLSGLRQMYDNSKGEVKSKCIKSAIFGDPDNLWEVLFYPNSGVKDKDSDQYFSSLYLWCVPTQQEREQALGGKWVRKGLWWFRFEVRVNNDAGKAIPLGSPKDASNHTFAAETATNWGWQKFSTRDSLFKHPLVEQNDYFTIVCTITSQPQPPAGHWLGLGIPQRPLTFTGDRPTAVGGWTGGDGASGGVAGGTHAAGGPMRVIPRDLVSAVGEMLDDPLYSDIEFVIPGPKSSTQNKQRGPPRKIYANKKLLNRCDYFDAMFHGGFGEADGSLSDGYDDDDMESLSDSDAEDEAADYLSGPFSGSPAVSPPQPARTSTPPKSDGTRSIKGRDEGQDEEAEEEDDDDDGDEGTHDGAETHVSGSSSHSSNLEGSDGSGEGRDKTVTTAAPPQVSRKRARDEAGVVAGPRKTRVVVRDAAWSTWWAVLYWLYTDTVYFAPLSSSFGDPKTTTATSPSSRREWIAQWLSERGMTGESGEGPVGPRPVSAKAVYRLADKLDLPALKLRAFQHIISQLTPYNIPAEVFSRFSTMFDEVRKVQLAYFLKNWAEIKKSDTMKTIWSQIRTGKHVGFEEVWPLIMSQLDYRSN